MRATAVIIKDGMILLMHRFRNNIEFFVLPGGEVEDGETIERAVIREVKEETGFNSRINKKICEFENEYNGNKNMHHFYLITEFSGELKLGGEEALENSESNKFILEWHKIEDIAGLPLKPEKIKNVILENFIN